MRLANKSDREIALSVPGAAGSSMSHADQAAASNPPAAQGWEADGVTLSPQAVVEKDLTH